MKIFISFLLVTSVEAFARPEYALKFMTNRCTTCHTNPVGGGHRNVVGKTYGPKPAALEAFSRQDVFGFDFRTIFYTPVQKEDRESGKSGIGVMAALPSMAVPFYKQKSQKWSLVYSHNVGGFYGTTPHDAYLKVQLYEDYRWYPQSIIVGRFSAPFGLLDDEHRTYIRQQTRTSWNDKEVGLLLSGDWSPVWHYDLAFVNGEQTAGAGFGGNQVALWGSILNVRALFASWGWMFGASASYYNNEKSSSALSIYQNLSVGNLTKGLLPGNLITEAVLARQMNSRLPTQFVSELKFKSQVEEADSIGYKVQWNYNIQPMWKLILKYDHLIPDREYASDSYQRYGVGLRHFFNIKGRNIT